MDKKLLLTRKNIEAEIHFADGNYKKNTWKDPNPQQHYITCTFPILL
jgi:hypothetical protein